MSTNGSDSVAFGVTPGEGRDVALTESEQAAVNKLLGDPTYFPIEFRRWLKDYIENSDIRVSKSQIIGGGSSGAGAATGLPPGLILPYTGPKIGADCLICDGKILLQADYPELYAVLSTTWNASGGSGTVDTATQFRIPDLRDRALYGQGSSIAVGSVDGKSYGSRGGPSHSHTLTGGTGNGGAHNHNNTFGIGSAGAHTHDTIAMKGQSSFIQSGTNGGYYFYLPQDSHCGSDNPGNHSHTLSGGVSAVGDHTHSLNGATTGDSQRDKPSHAGVVYVITCGRETV